MDVLQMLLYVHNHLWIVINFIGIILLLTFVVVLGISRKLEWNDVTRLPPYLFEGFLN